MALKGSVSVEATPNARDMLVFSWEAVQDTEARTSTVTWKMEMVADEYGTITGVPVERDWKVVVDGQEFTGTRDVNMTPNETRLMATGEIVLEHNEDGTRSFDFTFSQDLSITWGASSGNPQFIGVVTGEGVGELDAFVEQEPEKYPILDWVTGYILSLCSPTRAFPKREPVDNAPVLIATELDFGGFIDGNTSFDVGGYPSDYTVTETKGTNVTALHYGVFFDSVDYWRLCVPGKKYRMQAKFPKIEYTLPSGVEKTSESIYISFPGAALTYPNPPYKVDCDVDGNGISVLLDPHPDYPNAYNHLSAEMAVDDGYYVLTIEYEISSLQDNPGGYLYIGRCIAVSPDREITRTVIYPAEPLKIWEI